MQYNNDLVAFKLRDWEKYLSSYRLPDWDVIPDIGLYMEQVICVLKEFLDYLPPELKDDEIITAAAINNYVRKKIMPKPHKKRYYRTHIAYLLIICSLKQSLHINTIQAMIPVNMSPDELRSFYKSYSSRHSLAAEYFVGEIRKIASGILNYDSEFDMATDKTEELIEMVAVISGFNKLLAQKLLPLENMYLDDFEKVSNDSDENKI